MALITRGATTTMRELKWNAPLILPFTEDIKKLDFHMENVRVVAERMLTLCPSTNNYAALAKVVIFKRRRGFKNGVGHIHSKEEVRSQ